ncbi:M50 family metallopeptidase [Collinsella sp. An2]|uniref:M50 family metallopeptidase n=1 Tax=Collinsella sp. An2 TaxID=1965585 RepID=UPI000B391229|nr:M50 family metallopeptidase [Collinsella sp. An2]OUP08225.1 hypothetical protein B5F33_07360 [Collinsella sp. An2]
MDAVLGIIGPIFWGLLMLSVLVGVHEGGHFLAARACGVRVTEFFLGLPCRFNLHHVSRKVGTKFGVTPLLLGGYAMICGMDPTPAAHAPAVLGLVHRRGSMSVEDIAHELDITEDEAMEACVHLMGWGSLSPVYDESKGEGPSSKYYPTTYASMPRDAAGNTIYDGRLFDRAHATSEGDVWEPTLDDEAFYAQERSRTYLGKGFWKRAFMLVAGIAVNILSGFLLLMSIYSIVGVSVPTDSNVIGSIQADSPAEAAGLEAGDTVIALGDAPVASWTDLVNAAQSVDAGEVSITYERDGAQNVATLDVAEGESLGITESTTVVHLNPIDSARVAGSYVVMTATSVAQLLNPSRTLDVLNGSTSIVGISVMSAEAAAAGPATFLTLGALISFSLGFMNLLPIPPLDGGKLVIEIIQAIIRRPLPLRVQNIISYVGVGIFAVLFIYLLRGDILRFIF